MEPKDCTHPDFAARVNVGRFEDSGKYMADVTINCTVCGVAMRFVGVSAGVNFGQPMVSIDSTELRAPIEPAIFPVLQESASFTMPQIPKRH